MGANFGDYKLQVLYMTQVAARLGPILAQETRPRSAVATLKSCHFNYKWELFSSPHGCPSCHHQLDIAFGLSQSTYITLSYQLYYTIFIPHIILGTIK